MIVVDTNIIAYFFLKTEQAPAIEHVFRKDNNWVVPYVWRFEFRNVLVTYLRHRRLTLQEAVKAFEKAADVLAGQQFDTDAYHVLELAILSGRSAYDCEFVALAEQYRVPLVTADVPLQKAFPKIAISIEEFLKLKT
ncbi:MAG: type II toxin-antitoxin system VapC family toxin [Candidatus Omnitrophica bacterium]|nr:type II toxin-antitoxin system VapC family toxin [Candidatus Omnitrophota bacterium]